MHKIFILVLLPFTIKQSVFSQTDGSLFGDGYHGKEDTLIRHEKIKRMKLYVASTDSSPKFLFRVYDCNKLGQFTRYEQYAEDGIHKIYQEDYEYNRQNRLVQTIAVAYPVHPNYKELIEMADDRGSFLKLRRLNSKKELVIKSKYSRAPNGYLKQQRSYFDDTFCDSIGTTFWHDQPNLKVNPFGRPSIEYDAPAYQFVDSVDSEGNPLLRLKHKEQGTVYVVKYYSQKSLISQILWGLPVSVLRLTDTTSEVLYSLHYDEVGRLHQVRVQEDKGWNHYQYHSINQPHFQHQLSILSIQDHHRFLTVNTYDPYLQLATQEEYLDSDAGRKWQPRKTTFFAPTGLTQKAVFFLEKKQVIFYYDYQY